MSRPKGSKNKQKANKVRDIPLSDKELVTVANMHYERAIDFGVITPTILSGDELFKAARDAGFPQGGVGNWRDVNNERIYVPHPSEVYNQFIADPVQWEEMAEAMLRVWIANRT